jgi:simple sugar transport system ATP-binding protein
MSFPLELVDVHKRFGALVALDGVTVRLAAGRVHGVLGENGAGKSTLMNVAYGMVRPDGGGVRAGGREVRFGSPREAIAAGVGMVHQHFMLAGAMTVLDNVLLGDRRAPRWLSRRDAAERLVALAERVGLPVEPGARVDELSVGGQQRVEILKALWRDARVLILDEPTAVLTPPEAEQLFGAVDRLKAEGRAVAFISHKLGEVKRVCDDVTVLRRGRVAWSGRAADVSAEELARQMVGREVAPVVRGERTVVGGEVVLELERVTAAGVHEVSLAVRAGEIVGIAGVDGNGQQALAELVVGLRRPANGRVLIGGEDVGRLSLKDRMARGMAHVPNDRKREALVTSMSVAENVVLKRHDRRPFARAGWMSWGAARRLARRLAGAYDVRAASVETAVGTLSGGNQQKVVLARELALVEPRVIVAMNPTRGLDVAATRFVHEQLLARRDGGTGVLFINSDLDELLAVCDRVAVLYAGRLRMTGFPATTREEIGRLMAGVGA